MAVVKCTKCGAKINNVTGGVINCPSCGHVMHLNVSEINTQPDIKSQVKTQQKPTKKCKHCKSSIYLMQRCVRSAARNREVGV